MSSLSHHAFLYLETGEIYAGKTDRNFATRVGEVVFNTSHSGYEEIATDPSYFNQIMVMTSPMQGNYGVDERTWESKKFWIEGFAALKVHQTLRAPTWFDRLAEHNVPLISEIDTRELVLRLRSGGTVWGALLSSEKATLAQEKIKDAKKIILQKRQGDGDWVYQSSRKSIEVQAGSKPQGPRLAVMDLGVKENILRELRNRCSEVVVLPSRTNAKQVMDLKVDGVVLSNGPGDPALVEETVQTTRDLVGKTPLFGICMGHQILGLALGGSTYKLKFGHRGSNHPIQDDLLKRVYISSQNHGYAVDPASLPRSVKSTHTNLNDGTCAGFYSEEKKLLGIQYHPESHPGPHDAENLFDFFIHQLVQRP